MAATDASPFPETMVHGSAVAHSGGALLLVGPSGSGKSGLALALMAHGARLVSDDRTRILPCPEGPPLAAAPDTLLGLIEARGIGLLAVEPAPPTPIRAVVDLAEVERERFPPQRRTTLAGFEVPLLRKVEMPHFPAALIQYLVGGTCVR